MLKKIICLVLALSLCFATPVFAADSSAKGTLYVATTDCPQEYIDFAEEHISKYIMSMQDNLDYGLISVGSPFAFADEEADVYYFPVIYDDEIYYLFRVYPDGNGGYAAAITCFLAQELNNLAELTSEKNPLSLHMVGNKIVASVENSEYVLFEYPADLNEDAVSALSAGNALYSAVDVKKEIGFDLSFVKSRAVSNYIELDLIEKQGSNSWCAAYASSTIMRTLGYYCTAVDLIIYFYDEPLSKYYVSETQIRKFASDNFGLSPINVYYSISNELLYNEIDNGRPVYFKMMNIGYTSGHAIVLRGYDAEAQTWSIWNPWFTFYESFTMGERYVPTGHSSEKYAYAYTGTMYNWCEEAVE